MIKQIIFVAAVTLLPGAIAFANGVGNGGGGWVCREPNGAIRWSQLVDLFEAKNEYGLTLATYTGSVRDIVDLLQVRVLNANKEFYDALIPYIEKVAYLEHNPPQITHTQDVLTVVDDALFHLQPAPNRCGGGKIAYEQVLNYKNDGLILVQSEIFKSFVNRTKAALVLHEAVYAYRRDNAQETNSVNTRRIVGLVLSTLSIVDLKKALADLEASNSNVKKMSFKKILRGSFMMGSSENEPGRQPCNEHQRVVTLTRDFEMQTTTVTQFQWFKVMGNSPSYFSDVKYCPTSFIKINGVAMCPNHPVEQVSWDDVQIFISRLNGNVMSGYVYRLPTEAEWEYSARARSAGAYFFGNDPAYLVEYAYYSENSEVRGETQTQDVGTLRPNNFGLYDMYGNVNQWVQDYTRYNPKIYWIEPTCTSPGSYRVTRGSDILSHPNDMRSAVSDASEAGFRSKYIGFRLVRTKNGKKNND